MENTRSRMPVKHRRQAILDFIQQYRRDHHGRSPSQREIAEAAGFKGGAGTLNTYHLDYLCEKGYIQYEPGMVRSIIVMNPIYEEE